MKKIILLSMIAFLTVSLSEVEGQVVNRFIKKRQETAENAAIERTGKEADKAVKKEVNKALDKIFGNEEQDSIAPSRTSSSSSNSPSSNSSGSSSSSNAEMNALMGAMGISTGTANVKPAYEFDGFIEMTITEFKNGKQEDESLVYKTFIDSKSLDYGMVFKEPGEEDRSVIIFDTENSLMLTLAETDDEKTGFAIGFTPDQIESMAEDMNEDEGDIDEAADAYSAYKTGKTKKILGYQCEEYIIEDDEGKTTMWVTNDLNKELKKSYLKNSSFTGMFTYAYYTNGMVMEYIIEDKSDNETSVMTVTDIDLNKKSTISTMGYTIMNMGALMQEEEEE